MKINLAFAVLLAAATHVAHAQGGGSSPVGVAPNYKPGGNSGTRKPVGKDIIVRSGGQGHNSGPGPKGKTVVAPTTGPAHPGKRTPSTTPANAQ